MQNIVCVKWGQKFSPAYVNNLYKGVINNTKEKVHFYCLTDDSTGLLKGIEVIPTPFPEVSSGIRCSPRTGGDGVR